MKVMLVMPRDDEGEFPQMPRDYLSNKVDSDVQPYFCKPLAIFNQRFRAWSPAVDIGSQWDQIWWHFQWDRRHSNIKRYRARERLIKDASHEVKAQGFSEEERTGSPWKGLEEEGISSLDADGGGR